MLKREIKYEDFNGETQADIFYFNISRVEVIELEAEYKTGIAAMLQYIVDTKDSKQLVNQFKRLILLAYGEKSEDGKSFVKSDELRDKFSQTAAYEALYMELLSNPNAAPDFFDAVLPKNMGGEEKKDQDKPSGPPLKAVPPVPPSN